MEKPLTTNAYDSRNNVMGGEYRGVGLPGKVGSKQTPQANPPKKKTPPRKV